MNRTLVHNHHVLHNNLLAGLKICTLMTSRVNQEPSRENYLEDGSPSYRGTMAGAAVAGIDGVIFGLLDLSVSGHTISRQLPFFC
jgi:hypothetical protein